MHRSVTAAFVLLAAVLLASPALPQVVPFAELVQQLRAKPGDAALRERVVSEGAALRSKPAIPEEARAAFMQANAMVQAATDSTGQRLAIERYNTAINLAPWWGDAYFNRGLAQELVGDLEAAKTSYRLYLRSGPPEADARTAQDKIYGVEGRIALRSRPAPAPPPPQVTSPSPQQTMYPRAWVVRGWNGARQVPNSCVPGNFVGTCRMETIEVVGKVGRALSVTAPVGWCRPTPSPLVPPLVPGAQDGRVPPAPGWRYGYKFVSGSLPNGLRFGNGTDGAWGQIFGVPTQRGEQVVVLRMEMLGCEGLLTSDNRIQEIRFRIRR
jgi:hypothetical protein